MTCPSRKESFTSVILYQGVYLSFHVRPVWYMIYGKLHCFALPRPARSGVRRCGASKTKKPIVISSEMNAGRACLSLHLPGFRRAGRRARVRGAVVGHRELERMRSVASRGTVELRA